MNNKIFKIFLMLFLFATLTSAQQIYFCESVSSEGEPENAKPAWELGDNESSIEILFDNGETSLPEGTYYLFVDKKNEGGFEPFDSKTINKEDSDSWMSVSYQFREKGVYDIYFMDADRKKLASKKINIYEEGTMPSNIKAGQKPRYFRNSYYSGMKLTYCERVISDKPVNIRDYTSLSKDEGILYTHLENYKPMNTDTVYVEVWFKEPHWDEFSEFVESKKYRINKYWSDTFFRYKFEKVGVYKFMVYDQNYDLIISTKPLRVHQ